MVSPGKKKIGEGEGVEWYLLLFLPVRGKELRCF